MLSSYRSTLALDSRRMRLGRPTLAPIAADFAIRSNAIPRRTRLCLKPGAGRPHTRC